MSGFSIGLATIQDEPELQRIVRTTLMQGALRLGFHREPSFFDALGVEGAFNQVITCCETGSDRLVGFGTRSVKDVFVNGEPASAGYLSLLRLEKEYRNGHLLGRGYRLLRELHKDNRVVYYLTTIMGDNKPAIRILTSNKAGLPQYEPKGRYFTKVINPAFFANAHDSHSVRRCASHDIEQVMEFLSTGKGKQFFPRYTAHELLNGTGLLRGLRSEDIFISHEDGRINGVAGFWDQSSFRQIIVHGYDSWLSALKPFYNLYAKMAGAPLLPSAGTALKAGYCALPIVKNNDFRTFRMLLVSLCKEAYARGYHYIIAGAHERDSLLFAFRGIPCLTLVSNIYLVKPDQEKSLAHIPDDRIPYLETGSL